MKTVIIVGIITVIGIVSGLGLRIHQTNSIFREHIARGDRAYRDKEFQKALASYRQAHQLKSTPEAAMRIELVLQTQASQPHAVSQLITRNREAFRGLYERENKFLALRFLDEVHVDLLARKDWRSKTVSYRKLGDTVTYRIEGDLLSIPHACGVMRLKIVEDDRLLDLSSQAYYIRGAPERETL